MNEVVIADADIITAYGHGVDALWEGLLANRSAISPVERFPVDPFSCKVAGFVPGLDRNADESLVEQMLRCVASQWSVVSGQLGLGSADACRVLLATTTGEIDLLERSVEQEGVDPAASCFDQLLAKTCSHFGLSKRGQIISSACASSTVAIGLGASMIRAGETECVLVVGCDCVSEFVFSGFSALRALDSGVSRPFDASRGGLNVGEATGYVLLMSEEVASREGCHVLGKVLGWGMTNDANHMTGPSRDGDGLMRAINLALKLAAVDADDVGAICAHGTGTMYNDSMEMKAFRRVFDQARPTFSIKGGTAHTMGAAGLVETVVSCQVLNSQLTPPSVGVADVDEEAAGWVYDESVAIDTDVILSTNSGFGGVNAALVLGVQ